MKILQVIPGLSMRTGGPAPIVTEASLALNRRGVETTVVATDARLMASAASPERLTAEDLPPGAEHLDLRLCPAQRPRRFLYSSPLNRLLHHIVPNYDAVHIHALYLFPDLAAYRAAERHHVPYVVSPHSALDPYLRRQRRVRKAVAWRLWQRAALERAAALHIHAPEELAMIDDIAPEVPRAMVPNGVRWSAYQALPSGQAFRNRYVSGYDGPLVMFLGRLAEKKRVDILIDAFAQVIGEGVEGRLVIAGPDHEGIGTSLRELVRRRRIQDRTVFTGMLQGEEKLAALAATDIWALSSRSEGFAMAVVEALAAGRACLLSPAIFIAPEVERAGAGILCELTADSFSQAMMQLLTEPARCARMGDNARVFAKRYDWDVVSADWEAMYSRAVASRGDSQATTDRAA